MSLRSSIFSKRIFLEWGTVRQTYGGFEKDFWHKICRYEKKVVLLQRKSRKVRGWRLKVKDYEYDIMGR